MTATLHPKAYRHIKITQNTIFSLLHLEETSKREKMRVVRVEINLLRSAPSPNPRAKPSPLKRRQFLCFELKTQENGGGAAGRKKGKVVYI